MKRLAQFPLQDGGFILVEVDGQEQPEPTMRGLAPLEVTEKAAETFDSALAKVRPAVEAMIASLRGLSQSPDSVGLEFGLKLNAAAGAVIASAAVEANFKVTLTWKRSTSG
jgi:hypothetical protein